MVLTNFASKGWILVVCTALLTAGCTGDSEDGAPQGARGPVPGGIAEVTATEGAIQGVVVDDESRPLEGASISLLAAQAEAITDSTGYYAVSGLPAGTYAVAVLARGYEPAARQAQVAAGEVVWANFTLRVLPSVEPYVEIIPKTSFVNFGQRQLSNLVLHELNQTCTECKHPIHLNDDPYALMTEVSFTPAYSWPFGSHRVCMDYHRNYTGDSPLAQGNFIANTCIPNGGSHLLTREENNECSACVHHPTDQITAYMSGEEPFDCVGCVPNMPTFQQRIDLWFSIPHHGPLPDGWTALPPT